MPENSGMLITFSSYTFGCNISIFEEKEWLLIELVTPSEYWPTLDDFTHIEKTELPFFNRLIL